MNHQPSRALPSKALSDMSYERTYASLGRGFDEAMIEWLELTRRSSIGSLSTEKSEQPQIQRRNSSKPYSQIQKPNKNIASSYFSFLSNPNNGGYSDQTEILQESMLNDRRHSTQNSFSPCFNFRNEERRSNNHLSSNNEEKSRHSTTNTMNGLYNHMESTFQSLEQDSRGNLAAMTSTIQTTPSMKAFTPRTSSSSDISRSSYPYILSQSQPEISELTLMNEHEMDPNKITTKEINDPIKFLPLNYTSAINTAPAPVNQLDPFTSIFPEKNEDLLKWLEEQPASIMINDEQNANEIIRPTSENNNYQFPLASNSSSYFMNKRKRMKTDLQGEKYQILTTNCTPSTTITPSPITNSGHCLDKLSLWDDCLFFGNSSNSSRGGGEGDGQISSSITFGGGQGN